MSAAHLTALSLFTSQKNNSTKSSLFNHYWYCSLLVPNNYLGRAHANTRIGIPKSMIRKFLILLVALLSVVEIGFAQKLKEKEKVTFERNSRFGAKLLTLDHQLLNMGDGVKLTNAIELSYQRAISKQFTLVFPVKIGSARFVDQLNNETILGIDGTFHFNLSKETQKLLPYLTGWSRSRFGAL